MIRVDQSHIEVVLQCDIQTNVAEDVNLATISYFLGSSNLCFLDKKKSSSIFPISDLSRGQLGFKDQFD